MKPIELIIPMSGQGVRYQAAGYKEPKPLIPVNGKPMIERLLENFPDRWPVTFVMAENHKATPLPEFLLKLRPKAKQLFIPPHKEGPGRPILAALEHVPAESPVLVSYCDYAMVWDPAQFERFVKSSACDGALVSYRGFHAHYLNPVTYAYSRMQGERVVEVKEKGSFTDNRENEYASAGAYYFRTGKLLKEALEHQKERKLILNGESYTSLTMQALLDKNPQSHVRVFEIQGFFQWGTPQDLQVFEYWERCFGAFNHHYGKQTNVSQVLMPMAGLGSRFKEATQVPKPFIPVFGKPMFEAALDSLPRPETTVIVSLKDVVSGIAVSTNREIIALDTTPKGQALSTEAGCPKLKSDSDVIVSSCDHAIVLDPDRWMRFRNNPQCDAAIFTVRGFPGTMRKPTAFSYVVPSMKDSKLEFPLVERVSLKKNTTEKPEHEHLLVGTFWFKDAKLLVSGINALKAANVTMNGELYLDTVFDVLQKLGHQTRIIELDGYINWGDPDSMAEAFYWQEIFCGRQIAPRPRHPGVK